VSAAGQSAPSARASPVGETPRGPLPPAGFAAITDGPGRIALIWEHDAGAGSYEVTGAAGARIAIVRGDVMHFTVTSLRPSTTYCYALDAVDPAGRSALVTACGRTGSRITPQGARSDPLDRVPPFPPSPLLPVGWIDVTAPVNLCWQDNGDPFGRSVKMYRVSVVAAIGMPMRVRLTYLSRGHCVDVTRDLLAALASVGRSSGAFLWHVTALRPVASTVDSDSSTCWVAQPAGISDDVRDCNGNPWWEAFVVSSADASAPPGSGRH
jgi:hypothetical protein